ncbi:HNH endonuclease [Pseudotabrizicola sp.]|uniref:HNH endonuclease n=1 Tax=Pseudotabrizicola sp. TaxID=2939647 RepID=UPI0027311D57|nr:HNH endonuclease [Pseudotabrizicola sp.]MDP2079519.1 HNH endonuclease [Pseudotabrizicola sp.]
MIASRQDIIREELELGTGATIGISVDQSGTRTALRIWFSDLDVRNGPVAELRPFGLKGYQVTLSFGTFSGEIVRQIQRASDEDVGLARALLSSIDPSFGLSIPGQSPFDWRVASGDFKIIATARGVNFEKDDALIKVCRDAIVPIMAAMAELIGYDVIDADDDAHILEGAILFSTVRRRERNPRNRLLCIRLHGEKCACCGLHPETMYGTAGSIIEVHHLHPLSLLTKPREYDPAVDLVPLCPNCHRAAHTRKPFPWSLEELRELMALSVHREARG